MLGVWGVCPQAEEGEQGVQMTLMMRNELRPA